MDEQLASLRILSPQKAPLTGSTGGLGWGFSLPGAQSGRSLLAHVYCLSDRTSIPFMSLPLLLLLRHLQAAVLDAI